MPYNSRRLGQEDGTFEASLGYIGRTSLKNKITQLSILTVYLCCFDTYYFHEKKTCT